MSDFDTVSEKRERRTVEQVLADVADKPHVQAAKAETYLAKVEKRRQQILGLLTPQARALIEN